MSEMVQSESKDKSKKITFHNEAKRDFWDDGDGCVKYDKNKEG